ncbi:hypothetical protein B2J93_9470 [Marssonina coronariae]|uniref:Uncharacterized protein n=1 Tax=Diplocarpon coronariae TaxID=2795749 RepID=A0A218YW89_9HELO|nr:hypothetical protein B2J93_9470 [Marssonina coronariae]
MCSTRRQRQSVCCSDAARDPKDGTKSLQKKQKFSSQGRRAAAPAQEEYLSTRLTSHQHPGFKVPECLNSYLSLGCPSRTVGLVSPSTSPRPQAPPPEMTSSWLSSAPLGGVGRRSTPRPISLPWTTPGRTRPCRRRASAHREDQQLSAVIFSPRLGTTRHHRKGDAAPIHAHHRYDGCGAVDLESACLQSGRLGGITGRRPRPKTFAAPSERRETRQASTPTPNPTGATRGGQTVGVFLL